MHDLERIMGYIVYIRQADISWYGWRIYIAGFKVCACLGANNGLYRVYLSEAGEWMIGMNFSEKNHN